MSCERVTSELHFKCVVITHPLDTHVPHIHLHLASTGVRGEEVEEEGEKEEMEEEGEASESGSEDFLESFQELPLQQVSLMYTAKDISQFDVLNGVT